MRVAMRELFEGRSVSEAATDDGHAPRPSRQTGVLIDPHTAVASGRRRRRPRRRSPHPLVVLATAHPAKFPEAVGRHRPRAASAPPLALLDRPERFDRLPADAEAVKAYVRAFGHE